MSDYEEAAPGNESFAKLLKQEAYDYVPVRRGDLRKGVITALWDDNIIVDIGSKQDAFIPPRDLEAVSPELVESLHVGSEIHVLVRRILEDGSIIVSLADALQESDWLRATELLESGDVVDCPVVDVNRGGVLVLFGRLTGFVPASSLYPPLHIRKEEDRVERFRQLIGQTLTLKVVEVNRRRHRLILSQREARAVLQQRRLETLMTTLHIGEHVRGRVHTLTEFGAFIDLGGADGLVHISEITWKPIRSPREVLRVGDEVEAVVIRLNKEKKQIALSMKQLEPNPWDGVGERYRPGDVVQATITNVRPFGAFARLEEGIDGLIHISQLSNEQIQSPKEVVHVGDVVNVRVLEVNESRQRISLSLKQAPQWEEVTNETSTSADRSPSEDITADAG